MILDASNETIRELSNAVREMQIGWGLDINVNKK